LDGCFQPVFIDWFLISHQYKTSTKMSKIEAPEKFPGWNDFETFAVITRALKKEEDFQVLDKDVGVVRATPNSHNSRVTF
jgi:hypothetical protein